MPQTAKTLKAANGETLGFMEYIPTGTPKGTIIFLHGQGERGNGTSDIQSVSTNGIPNYCSRNVFPYDFIVLSPQLDRKYSAWPTWQVDELIAYADTLKYNTSVLALTGLSLGGGGTWLYATSGKSRSRITHVAPVCGTGDYVDANLCSIANLWAFHCVDDTTVTVTSGNITQNFNESPVLYFGVDATAPVTWPPDKWTPGHGKKHLRNGH